MDSLATAGNRWLSEPSEPLLKPAAVGVPYLEVGEFIEPSR